MKLKLILSFALALATFTTVNAQKIKLKKGIVYIDEQATFAFERRAAATECSIYSLDKADEILFIKTDNRGTARYLDDDFKLITFIKSDKKVESKALSTYSIKNILGRLLKGNVLDLKGNIDEDKLQAFITKHHQIIRK